MDNRKLTINFGTPTIIITALLCLLKLLEVIAIPWIWCFCLIWLPFFIAAVFCIILIIIVGFWAIIKTMFEILIEIK